MCAASGELLELFNCCLLWNEKECILCEIFYSEPNFMETLVYLTALPFIVIPNNALINTEMQFIYEICLLMLGSPFDL